MNFWAVSVATPEMFGRGLVHIVVEALNEMDARVVTQALFPFAQYVDITVSPAIDPPAMWRERTDA